MYVYAHYIIPVPTVRWEERTGDSPSIHRPASVVNTIANRTTLLQIAWDVKTDT